MVLVENKKYACETCIKGHRSSSCKHTDRPLFEIKKKGRPVTQCDHCRELRKTKQVHVKCICEKDETLSDTPSIPPSSSPPRPRKKGKTTVPERAAFPHGLPEALEASVAPQSSSESVSSDSEHGGSCSCKSGGECHCCTPRKSAPRKPGQHSSTRGGAASASSSSRPKERSPARQSTASPSSRMQNQIMARIAELRPVLPRPASHYPPGSGEAGPVHHPSSGVPHASRHHGHDRNAYSPYNRAYEFVYNDPLFAQNNPTPLPQALDPRLPSDNFDSQQLSALNALQFATTWNDVAGLGQNVSDDSLLASFPSACGCGDSCQCPGCIEHNAHRAPSPSAFSSCANPGACSSCLDCTILSLPASIPPSQDPTIPPTDPYQSQALEEWLRRVSGNASSSASPSPSISQHFGQLQITQPPNVHGGSISPLQQIPGLSEGFVNAMTCMGETCGCPPGMCQCIQCEGFGTTPDVTFATSGERGSLAYQQSAESSDYTASASRNVATLSSHQDPAGRYASHGSGQGMDSGSSSLASGSRHIQSLAPPSAGNMSGPWTFGNTTGSRPAPIVSTSGYARSHSSSSSSLDEPSNSPFRDNSRYQ